MPLVRGPDGQLREVSDEEAQALTQKALSPLTPKGQADQGADPQVAKMAGTQAQKTPVLDAAVQAPTLRQEQRQVRRSSDGQTQSPAQTTQAEALGAFGSLGQRVEAKIRAMAQEAQTATPEVSEEALAGFQTTWGLQDQDDRIRAYFDQLPQDPEARQAYLDSPAGQEDLAQLAQDTGLAPEALGDLGNLLQVSGESLAEGVQAATPELVRVADLDVAELGVSEKDLADALGITPEALGQLTLSELQVAVQDVEARDFSQVDQLRAELATAGPNRRRQILTQLGELDATGVSAVEAGVEALAGDLDSQFLVDLGDRGSMSIDQVLEDEVLSQLVAEAALDDQALEDLRERFPALAEYVESNRQALESVSEDLRAEATELTAVQEQFREDTADLRAVPGAAEFFDLPEGVLTSAQTQEFLDQLEKNPKWLVYRDDPRLRDLVAAGGAEVLEALPDISVPRLKELLTRSQEAAQNPELAAEFGFDPETGVFTSQAKAAKFGQVNNLSDWAKGKALDVSPKDLVQIYNAYPQGTHLAKKALEVLGPASEDEDLEYWLGPGVRQQLLGGELNPALVEKRLGQLGTLRSQSGLDEEQWQYLASNGFIPTKDLERVTKNPKVLQDWLDYHKTQDFLANKPSPGRLTEWLTGDSDVGGLIQLLRDLDNPRAVKSPSWKANRKAALELFDLNNDGRLDEIYHAGGDKEPTQASLFAALDKAIRRGNTKSGSPLHAFREFTQSPGYGDVGVKKPKGLTREEQRAREAEAQRKRDEQIAKEEAAAKKRQEEKKRREEEKLWEGIGTAVKTFSYK